MRQPCKCSNIYDDILIAWLNLWNILVITVILRKVIEAKLVIRELLRNVERKITCIGIGVGIGLSAILRIRIEFKRCTAGSMAIYSHLAGDGIIGNVCD